MTATKLLYLEAFDLLTAAARVERVSEDSGATVVVLDQTVFYPQGGGQPYDTGTISSPAARFAVRDVRFADGIVKHIGSFDAGIFAAGERVNLAVDAERRILHSRLHSAGHVVDMAVAALGLGWIPGKGYHFPQGPYVEYAGTLGTTDKEKLKADMETLCRRFVAENLPTRVLFPSEDEMKQIFARNPAAIVPDGKMPRVVMFGNFGVPCGGTHVRSLGEIPGITIRKIKQEGTNIRVGYDVVI